MIDLRLLLRLGLAWFATAGAVLAASPGGGKKVDFNRDIRPILSDNCFSCHGPDKAQRKADLRLDTRDGLLSGHDDVRNVVPGNPDESELYQRVIAADPDERMPDPKSNKSLSPEQIATIKTWIEQGAEYQGHWSYLKPARPEVPAVADPRFARNPVDHFILARIQEAGLRPSPEADRVTLIRRLSFDLTGLPPSRAEVAAFLADPSPDAYEKQVDRLLASPHYGERMAIYWLDLVRYADSIGYHSDNTMQVWPYRDYVIRSFNQDLPFDRFTVEQLAGDLLPDAGLAQKVASGYNRLLQTTEEGGAQAKEYEAKYAADRVRNVSTVWLGATMGCCQCHDHKFDPFTTKDFYALAAFFADVQEAAVGKREPGMLVPDDRQAAELRRLDDALAAQAKRLDAGSPELAAAQTQWEADTRSHTVSWDVLDPEGFQVSGESHLRKEPDGVLRDFGKAGAKETYTLTVRSDARKLTGFRLEVFDDPELPSGGPGIAPNGNFVLTGFKVSAAPAAPADAKPAPVKLREAVADYSQDGFAVERAIDDDSATGWAISPAFGKPHTAVFEAAEPVGGDGGTQLTFTLEFQSPFPQHQIGKFRLAATTTPAPTSLWLPPAVRDALAVAPERRDAAQAATVASYFRATAPALRRIRDEIAGLQRQKDEFVKTVPTSLVTTAGPPRTTRVLPRGNWMDESGPVVSPAVPQFLPPARPPGEPATRLDLARWIASRDNPMTARVFVNRLWKLQFGQGLSRSLEDLGSQGEWPTHPELLDWLAVEFMDSGWDVKRLVRLLATSATYRQTSLVTPELRERDPFNRRYARQSRFRLDAELVRDHALVVAGLLVDQLGGPSVKPYQPAGYWDQLNFPTRTYEADKGPNQYRRGLYTHWQRSFLHPSLQAFDAPTREECTAERTRANIPQQALVLLNDPTYVEAARAFAERAIREGGPTPRERVAWAFELATSRRPEDREVLVLAGLLDQHVTHFNSDPDAARKLLAVGQRPIPGDLNAPELAAWTSVARVLLNLHEGVTRD